MQNIFKDGSERKCMGTWKPDEKFLEFFLKGLIEEGEEIDIRNYREYKTRRMLSTRELVEEMRQGTQLGRKFYRNLYNHPEVQKDYEKYKIMATEFINEMKHFIEEKCKEIK